MARMNSYIAAATATLLSATFAQQFVMYTPGGDDTSVQRIDPIMAPGSISGHVHHVFGADRLASTLDYDVLQSSTCTTVGSADMQGNAQDHSIYWHPALFMEANDGSGYIRVPTNGHKMYYLDLGTGDKVEPFEFPHGFRMVGGDPFARAADGNNAVVWKCSTGGSYNEGESGAFPTGVSTCSDYPYFYGSVEFPHCWNGNEFDRENPHAHMAYPEGDPRGGACPSSHPKRLPHLFIENFFNINEVADKVKPNSFTLAQGDDTGYGMHQDFFNGWEDGALPNLLSTCPQPEFGNEDVGVCSGFKSSGASGSCSLGVQYKENVDTPGKFLPGCNPISNTNPAPKLAIAPLGKSTDQCGAASGGDSPPSPSSSSASPSGSSAPPENGYSPSSSAAASSLASAPYGSIATTTAFMTTLATLASAYAPSTTAYVTTTAEDNGWGQGRPTWGW